MLRVESTRFIKNQLHDEISSWPEEELSRRMVSTDNKELCRSSKHLTEEHDRIDEMGPRKNTGTPRDWKVDDDISLDRLWSACR